MLIIKYKGIGETKSKMGKYINYSCSENFRKLHHCFAQTFLKINTAKVFLDDERKV